MWDYPPKVRFNEKASAEFSKLDSGGFSYAQK